VERDQAIVDASSFAGSERLLASSGVGMGGGGGSLLASVVRLPLEARRRGRVSRADQCLRDGEVRRRGSFDLFLDTRGPRVKDGGGGDR